MRPLGHRMVRRRYHIRKDTGTFQRYIGWHCAQVHSWCFQVFREAAIHTKTMLTHVRTQRVTTDPAELAAPAGHIKIHGDTVARLHPMHLTPHLSHLARYLLAHDQG